MKRAKQRDPRRYTHFRWSGADPREWRCATVWMSIDEFRRLFPTASPLAEQ